MENDISKIISLIMENPDIIEKIKSLSQSSEAPQSEAENRDEARVNEDTSEVKASVDREPGADLKSRRKHLLFALKPYLSSERAKAIDSMVSISDILEIARRH